MNPEIQPPRCLNQHFTWKIMTTSRMGLFTKTTRKGIVTNAQFSAMQVPPRVVAVDCKIRKTNAHSSSLEARQTNVFWRPPACPETLLFFPLWQQKIGYNAMVCIKNTSILQKVNSGEREGCSEVSFNDNGLSFSPFSLECLSPWLLCHADCSRNYLGGLVVRFLICLKSQRSRRQTSHSSDQVKTVI